MPHAVLLAQPLATAEFIALDTETNGLARDRCELTEVGAVLVGGGELHDRWRSLAGSRRCSAAAGSPRWPTRSGSTSARPTARCPTPRPARACCARCCRG